MAERTDYLRDDIDYRRDRIGNTVDQISNRVNPRHVAARSSYRMRMRLINMKDTIMGNDEHDYPWQRRSERGLHDESDYATMGDEGGRSRVSEASDRATERLSQAGHAVAASPEIARRRTRGNPLAAGLVAFGGGILLGSALPSSRAEREALHRAEPALDKARDELRDTGRELANDMKESAQESMEQVKGEAVDSRERVQNEATDAARRAKERG